MDGRKIDKKYENFVDNIFVELTLKLNPFYKKLGITPNVLTFFSLVVTLIGEYYFYKDYYILAGILYLFGYYFDCADGNFARMYDMVTVFGDYFDHFSDIFKVILLIFLLYNKLGLTKNLLFIISIMLIFWFAFSVHMGCQQLIYNKPGESPTLSKLEKLCPNKEIIKYTKFFGVGTFQLVVSLILIFFEFFKVEN